MKLKYPLILASASPRRKELLLSAGLQFESVVRPVDESIKKNLAPQYAVQEIVQNKLKSYEELTLSNTVLCADTIVVGENRILGKPKDADDAFKMLTFLSGKKHQVITGVCIASPDSTKSFFCNTEVIFFRLDKEEINYIVERFTTMEIANINKLIRDPKNHTLKQLKGHNWFVISLPVVFRDGKYAIYYSKGAYSGQFILMKNIDGTWKDVCYSSVWNE